MAVRPSPSPTTSMSASGRSISRRVRLAIGSSSTIITVIGSDIGGLRLHAFAPRHGDRHAERLIGATGVQAGLRTMHLCEPSRGGLQADPQPTGIRASVATDAILDSQDEVVAAVRSAENQPGAAGRATAMTQRVLDQGLQ